MSAPASRPLVMALAPRYAFALTIVFFSNHSSKPAPFASFTLAFSASRCLMLPFARRSRTSCIKSSPETYATRNFRPFSTTFAQYDVTFQAAQMEAMITDHFLNFLGQGLRTKRSAIDYDFDPFLRNDIEAHGKPLEGGRFVTWVLSRLDRHGICRKVHFYMSTQQMRLSPWLGSVDLQCNLP